MRGFEVDSLYNFFSLELNYLVGKITMELPLSACVVMVRHCFGVWIVYFLWFWPRVVCGCVQSWNY